MRCLCSVNAFSALRETLPLRKRVFALAIDVSARLTRRFRSVKAFLPLGVTYLLHESAIAFASDVFALASDACAR